MLDRPSLLTATVRLLRSDDYLRLAEIGAFHPDERVELLEGWLYTMSPTRWAHGGVVTRLLRWLTDTLGRSWDVIPQTTYPAPPLSMPEPDIAIAPCAPPDARSQNVARLIIEVAVTSLARDRFKAGIYARAKVPEYWIVNLTERVLEVHRSPRGSAYTKRLVYREGETVRSTAIRALRLVLDEAVFPPAEIVADEAAISRRPGPTRRRPRRSAAGRTRSR